MSKDKLKEWISGITQALHLHCIALHCIAMHSCIVLFLTKFEICTHQTLNNLTWRFMILISSLIVHKFPLPTILTDVNVQI